MKVKKKSLYFFKLLPFANFDIEMDRMVDKLMVGGIVFHKHNF